MLLRLGLLGGDRGLELGEPLAFGVELAPLVCDPALAIQELGLHRREPGVPLSEHGRLAGDVRFLRQPSLVRLDLLGQRRAELLLSPRRLSQLGTNSLELSLELVELALVDGGRCGVGRRRRRRGVEVEPNERSIHLLPVDLRRDGNLTLAAPLKLCAQAGAEALLGLDLVLVLLVGLLVRRLRLSGHGFSSEFAVRRSFPGSGRRAPG
jgi:hypothetical protein